VTFTRAQYWKFCVAKFGARTVGPYTHAAADWYNPGNNRRRARPVPNRPGVIT
jgi:hypothetical protein